MTLKTNCKNFKARNCPTHALKIVDNYKFEVAYDKKYFGNDAKMLPLDHYRPFLLLNHQKIF